MSQYDQIKFTQWLPQYTTGHPGWAEKCASQGGHKHTNMYYDLFIITLVVVLCPPPVVNQLPGFQVLGWAHKY